MLALINSGLAQHKITNPQQRNSIPDANAAAAGNRECHGKAEHGSGHWSIWLNLHE